MRHRWCDPKTGRRWCKNHPASHLQCTPRESGCFSSRCARNVHWPRRIAARFRRRCIRPSSRRWRPNTTCWFPADAAERAVIRSKAACSRKTTQRRQEYQAGNWHGHLPLRAFLSSLPDSSARRSVRQQGTICTEFPTRRAKVRPPGSHRNGSEKILLRVRLLPAPRQNIWIGRCEKPNDISVTTNLGKAQYPFTCRLILTDAECPQLLFALDHDQFDSSEAIWRT